MFEAQVGLRTQVWERLSEVTVECRPSIGVPEMEPKSISPRILFQEAN